MPTTIHDLRRGMAPHFSPIRLMWAINELGAQRMQELHARTQLCVTQHRAVRVMAECGKVAVVWSGRDCDGVAYSGDVRLVNATLADVRRHIERYYEWADGPCNYTMMSPSTAALIHPQERDLTAEAHEEGRPQCICA